MRALLGTAALIVSTGAWANTPPPIPPPAPPPQIQHQHQAQHQTAASAAVAGSTSAGGAATSSASGGSAFVSGTTGAPTVVLPSLGSAGQCAVVGGGPGIATGSGGGGFLLAWESTNCRNYYIGAAWIDAGIALHDSALVDRGVALMASITDRARAAYDSVPTPVTSPTPVRPDWCGTASQAELRRHAGECGR